MKKPSPNELPCFRTCDEYKDLDNGSQAEALRKLFDFIGPDRRPTPLQRTLAAISQAAYEGKYEGGNAQALDDALKAIEKAL